MISSLPNIIFFCHKQFVNRKFQTLTNKIIQVSIYLCFGVQFAFVFTFEKNSLLKMIRTYPICDDEVLPQMHLSEEQSHRYSLV